MTTKIEVPRKLFLVAIRVFAYPMLLAVALFTILVTLNNRFNFAMVNGLFLGFTIGYLALLERVIPYDNSWHPSKKEWLCDGIYLLFTMTGGGLAMAVIVSLSSFFHVKKNSYPFLLEIIIAVIISSCCSYLFHRYSHMHPWLWRLHGIHHFENKVNVGNNGVNHILDVFGRRFFAQLLVMLMGISENALFVVSIFNIVQGYFSHANIDVKLAWVNYIVVTPEQHRLHHSKDLREAGHFSVDIPLWDAIFGTYVWTPGKAPKEIGVVLPKKFLPTEEIFKNLIHPFRRRRRKRAL